MDTDEDGYIFKSQKVKWVETYSSLPKVFFNLNR